MRKFALACAGVAAVMLVVALIGRFKGQATLTVGTFSFQARTLIVMANTALLAGVFSMLYELTKKK